jgi:pimeloyl-ACP methyl ester carboxylesterase
MSARVWDEVTPQLAKQHKVIALTLLGHRGGAPARHRPVTVGDLVGDVERQLDARGIGRAHIVGNSLGGWVAIELARRGRALTVTAFSPAGSWTAGTAEQTDSVSKIRRAARLARLGRALPMRLLVRSATVRRLSLRDVARHGDRRTAEQVYEVNRDLLGCAVLEDFLTTTEEIAPLTEMPCPITLAWGRADTLLPLDVNGAVARRRLPQAEFVVIDGVGHVPMVDDPDAVAQAAMSTTMREPPVSPFWTR